jgi:hypothetical protein
VAKVGLARNFGLPLALTVWLLAIYLVSQAKTGLSALELMRDLGVNYPAAWTAHHKQMQAMAERAARHKLGCELHDGKCGRKPRDLPQFKWVNTVVGNLKTGLGGAYHSFNFAK